MTSGGVTIPAIGTPHPDNSAFYSGVPSINARGPTYFEIRVPYVAAGIAGEPPNKNTNPLDEPADFSWTSEMRTVPYDRDIDDTLVANSFGDPFDPPLTREIKDPVLVIERNEAGFDPDDKLNFQDTVSDGAFWGADGGRCRLSDLDGRSVNASTPYWRKTYRIVFRMRTPKGVAAADAWKRCVADMGFNYFDNQTPPRKCSILTGTPEYLDGKGHLGDGTSWVYFVEYPTANWSQLGINNP